MKWLALLATLILGTTVVSASEIQQLEREIVELVEDVGRSVVSVAAVGPHFHPAGQSGLAAPAKSIGCGIVFDSQGHILTTSSVVGSAKEVEIRRINGETYTGRVVGIDAISDLAIVEVPDVDLMPARLGGVEDIKPGSVVFVIGNAFGSLPSVAMGVVSGIERDRDEDISSLRLAVPISPGDVGGPVVNSQGEVIGIVLGRLTFQSTYRSTQSGRGVSLGFATLAQPSNLAVALPCDRLNEIGNQLIERGSIRRGYLGVRVLDLTDTMREQIGDPDLQGVVVVDVIKGSPAESVGIRPGDVITDFNSVPVVSVESLRSEVLKTSPGEVVEIGFRRDSDDHTERVRVANHTSRLMNLQASRQHAVDAAVLRARIENLQLQIKQLKEELEKLE